MRIGIVGYGTIAEEHAKALAELGTTLVAVAGPSAASALTFAERHGVGRASGDPRDVITADDVDAVVITSPNAVHAEQALECLQHGKRVLCEVPFAMSAAEAQEIADRSSGANQMMVCQTMRYLAPLIELRERARDSAAVRQVVIRLVLNRTSNVGITGRRRTWTDDLVWHHGSHAVDTALWLVDDTPSIIQAVGTGWSDDGLPLDVGVLIRTARGSLLTCALSYRAQSASTDFLVICDGETLRYERGTLVSSRGEERPFNEAEEFKRAVLRQDAAFLRSIQGDTFGPTPADMLPAYRALEVISAETRGRPVRSTP